MISRRTVAPTEGKSPAVSPSYERNVQAYLTQKATIDQAYPTGRFVGIHDGRIVADGATLDELLAAVRALGLDPRVSLTVQAGAKYPSYSPLLGITLTPLRGRTPRCDSKPEQ